MSLPVNLRITFRTCAPNENALDEQFHFYSVSTAAETKSFCTCLPSLRFILPPPPPLSLA